MSLIILSLSKFAYSVLDKNLYPGLIICWSAGFASGEIKKEPRYAVVSVGRTVCLRGCERGGGELLRKIRHITVSLMVSKNVS